MTKVSARRRAHFGRLASALLFAVSGTTPAQQARPAVTAADYDRAAKVLDGNLRNSLRNARLEPYWIGESDALWFQRQNASGRFEYMLVEAPGGQVQPLLDRERLDPLLEQLLPKSAAPRELAVLEVRLRAGARLARLRVGGDRIVEVNLTTYAASLLPPASAKRDELRSPEDTRGLFVREHNLWLRERSSGKERQLTRDGVSYFAYGKLPEGSLGTVPYQRKQPKLPPQNVSWSPDGRLLVGKRLDERQNGIMPFIEWVPQDGSHRPIRYELRLNLPGDKSSPAPESLFLLDVASGSQRPLNLPAGWRAANLPFSWSAEGQHFQFIAFNQAGNARQLLQVETATGRMRLIVEESTAKAAWLNDYLYTRPNVRLLGGGKEVIWFSYRTGWGHLYLYDVATGALKRPLTSGDWLVRDLVAVDEKDRQLYFTASGREAGWDPYYRALYRVSLEGGEPQLLTPEKADHQIVPPSAADPAAPKDTPLASSDFSPTGRYFVDTFSTVGEPPVTRLRDAASGKVVCELAKCDASAVFAAGWRAPERTSVKSADGQFDLPCVIYYPPGYRKDAKYPVIDAFYGGPQMTNAPTTFAEAVAARNPVSRASLAELGFIVLTIDARGTPGRSQAFHDFGHGPFADPQIEDHIAGIRELAARLGTLDLTRVGVYGHSFGGYTSARAILSHPEFYRVCVSSAGPHNFHGFYDGLGAFVGLPDYGKGAHLRPTPQAVAANFQLLDNAPLAKNLRGRLMLVYGDMDENALPAVTIQLVDALIKANKTFDLVHLPNRTHEFFRNDPYYTRRMWDYFVEHLLGATPPENYELKLK